MRDLDADFEALKSMTRLAWELDFDPVVARTDPAAPSEPPTDP